ncbi:Origin recognition complex subunit 5 [Papilio machaon]|uniref:Origin recognition complex subunit 5 n=1 Tax=Papilio machaon TaxID=76193 RepID=A0A194QYH3_PAPMA|nr:Origin recognition complex subunit 5 [Papilio machaon]
MKELLNKVPCRENQLNTLLDLFGEYDEPLPYSIFISGSMATGKTLCLTNVLDYLRYKQITIDCIECYSPKIIFETILAGLQDEDVEIKCESLSDLTNCLNKFGDDKITYEPIIIIFDRAERLRTMDQTLMCTFLRLREFCNLNICTVFVTHLAYDNFYFKIGALEPIQIFFPNYTRDELFKIIISNHKTFIDEMLRQHNIVEDILIELNEKQLFANFLNAFLSVFYRPCRDLIELQHMAQINFIKYCEPIIREEIKASDVDRLWRHITPVLKSSLAHLYLRISEGKPVSPSKENKTELQKLYNFENSLKEELMSTKTFAQSFELPYYAKFLLIAAYLASYNPPKEDKRLFMKNHGKQRKRLQQVKAKAKITEKLTTQLGPKVFTLDRLLAIFYAILEEKIGLTSNLLAQIATLVELKLIAGSKEIDLDTAKYKCIVGYDFINAVAQTVDFNVSKYLYDLI